VIKVSKKTESLKGKNQEKPADKSRRQDVQEAADYDQTTIDPALAASGSDPDKLNSLLAKADPATQGRLISRMQQKHGNLFVQRMLAQRQESDEHRTGDGDINESQYTPEQWSSWASAAESGARAGFAVFQASARLSGVRINGPIAFGGRLSGPSIAPLITATAAGAGAPAEVAVAFSKAAGKAWKRWVRRVRVPGLPWYPSFAAYPGPMAPPTPNVATPLVMLAPGASIDASKVASSIMMSLGDLGNEPGAQEAATTFGVLLSTSFTVWLFSKQVMNVLGKGPVPSFAPPYVPVGPVIMGDIISVPGIIV
jgi:hypothetical protein